ncbi:LTV1 protein [Aphelenchoides avenae]|nr:LTV1 protein [Aphelenchus avenae]
MTEQPKEDGRTEMLRRFGLVRKRPAESDEDEEDDDDDEEADEEHDAVHPEDADSEEDDRKSRFTNYSMTSAVIKRPDGLKMIDDHFETLYEEYDEEKIGECDVDEEELGGYIEPDSDRFQELVREFQSARGLKVDLEKPDDEVKRLALDAYRKEQERGEQMEVISVDMPGAKRAKWDCESVLSTYTNIYNHPTLIREEPKRKGITKKDLKELEKMDDSMSVMSGFSVSTVRPRGETADERRARKAAIKEERRERRMEKKSNKEAFKQEKKQMDSLRSQPKIPSRPIK